MAEAGEGTSSYPLRNFEDYEERVIMDSNNRLEKEDSNLAGDKVDMVARELELVKRERDLMRKEIELMKRKNELRQAPSPSPKPQTNIRLIGDLLSEFDGIDNNFDRWQKQFLLLCNTYELDDGSARILMGSRMKGKAQAWFQSKPEFLIKDVGGILREMKIMFDCRPNRMKLRKLFESRRWQSSETFYNYYHDKIIKANQAQVPEEEMLDYLIDGISDQSLRNQARMQSYGCLEDLVQGFKNITMGPRTTSKPVVKEVPKSTGKENNRGNQGRIPRCFNCGRMGHLANECQQAKRERGSCYQCGVFGHLVKNCPARNVSTVDNYGSEDEFQRNLIYQINNRSITLYTLLDTGSPISFIKEKFVKNFEKYTTDSNKFCGINQSKNEKIYETETEAIQAIMNIDVTYDDSNSFSEVDGVKLNNQLPEQTKLDFKALFIREYLQPERPEKPNVNGELKLIVKDSNPFHYQPRRLSFCEKSKVRQILDDLLRDNIIQPSNSEYASPIVLVRKKNGEIRMCIDYRQLNKILSRDNHPLPLIEDQILARIIKSIFPG
nr:uncharacterized protein LOC111415500 [Onthophagus taurus]